jgi:hypothetical protein
MRVRCVEATSAPCAGRLSGALWPRAGKGARRSLRARGFRLGARSSGRVTLRLRHARRLAGGLWRARIDVKLSDGAQMRLVFALRWSR